MVSFFRGYVYPVSGGILRWRNEAFAMTETSAFAVIQLRALSSSLHRVEEAISHSTDVALLLEVRILSSIFSDVLTIDMFSMHDHVMYTYGLGLGPTCMPPWTRTVHVNLCTCRCELYIIVHEARAKQSGPNL